MQADQPSSDGQRPLDAEPQAAPHASSSTPSSIQPLDPPSPSPPSPTPQRLLILIGLVGSGKSTFINSLSTHHPTYIRSNQDVLGNRNAVIGHVRESLRRGRNGVVDRTNVDAGQRRHWIKLAGEWEEERSERRIWVHAVVFETPLELCEARLKLRTDHETLSPDRALVVLRRFSNTYVPPSLEEGLDSIVSLAPSDIDGAGQTERGPSEEQLEEFLKRLERIEMEGERSGRWRRAREIRRTLMQGEVGDRAGENVDANARARGRGRGRGGRGSTHFNGSYEGGNHPSNAASQYPDPLAASMSASTSSGHARGAYTQHRGSGRGKGRGAYSYNDGHGNGHGYDGQIYNPNAPRHFGSSTPHSAQLPPPQSQLQPQYQVQARPYATYRPPYGQGRGRGRGRGGGGYGQDQGQGYGYGHAQGQDQGQGQGHRYEYK